MSNGIGPNPLNPLSKIYLEQVAKKKKDDTYLEPDMKKRQANNEKARKELAKGPQMKNPHFEENQQGWDAVNNLTNVYNAMHEGIRDEDPEKGTAERKARLEKKRGMKLDDHPQYKKEEVEQVDEADSLAAMAARREKRLARQRKQMGTSSTGQDFGHDYGISSAERKKRQQAEFDKFVGKKTQKEGLDPVGQEDADIDNDGDTDKTDKYLHKRRKAIGKAIKKRMSEQEEKIDGGNLKKLAGKATKRIDADNDGDVDRDDPKEKGMGEFVPSADGKKKIRTSAKFESYSWRQDLSEIMTDDIDSKPIKEKKVNNKITINPKLGEAVEEMGGTLIEMVEIDEFEYMVEGLRQELVDEGHDPEAVDYALEEAKVTMGHDTEAPARERTRDKLKKKAKGFLGKMAYKGYHAARDAKRAASPMVQRVKTSAKRGIRKAALKVADKLKEETVDEAVYGGTPPEKKDTRMTVTAADKKGNTPAYQRYKAGDKRYKAASHMNEVYKGKHGQSDKEYADSRSQGGKMVSGDSKMSGAEYTHGRRVKAANPGMQPDVGGKTKPKSQGKMDKGTRADLEYRKANLKKEEMSPQEVSLQKKKAMLDKMIANRRRQELDKGKAPTKAMGEATEDSLRDRRMERGGVDGNTRYDRPPAKKATNAELGIKPGKTALQKEMEKKHGKGKSAMDIVRAEIRAKHGKGAIMDTKKK